jgi:uncharacterized protein (TIGR02246 family)
VTRDQNTAVVRERIEAFNDGDLERLMAGFTEDALWITGRTTVRGRDELRSFFGAAIKGLRPNLALRNLIVDDCHAACQMRHWSSSIIKSGADTRSRRSSSCTKG